ncbi:hypothetical protein [Salibacterium qingdaonense]|uniref:Uncharacterized protein n=1 Tax=Salibacterium qingdaonense TaxID=266892 RepID=A0A1I4MHZ9_9BACI|nr:hypothetical protein [Salibacterium qingdaonense]SFM03072.1 hypothetical protein SAMN04488054_11214 [Salibacterium qingdaonense]
MERLTYYVELEQPMMGITDIKTSENTIQYEIHATPNEKHELEKMINKVQHEELSGTDIMARVHDETKADQAKHEMKTEMQELYQKIYELGAPETKEFFRSQGLV